MKLEITASLIVSVLSFLLAVLLALDKKFGEGAHNKERLSTLEMKVGLFWRLVEERMAGALKLPTHRRMDELIDKLSAHTISLEELQELRPMVEARSDFSPIQVHRLIADLTIGAIDSRILELTQPRPLPAECIGCAWLRVAYQRLRRLFTGRG